MNRFITLSTFARLAAVGLLFWALARHRYDYFTILRWVTCAAALYTVYVAYMQKNTGWAWVMGVIAVLFNPFIIVRLKRETWTPIDVVTGIILLVSIWFVQEKRSQIQP